MAGPTENMKKAWKMIGSAIKIGKPTPVGKYLGCRHVADHKYFDLDNHPLCILFAGGNLLAPQ